MTLGFFSPCLCTVMTLFSLSVLLPGPPTAVSVVQSSADQASVLVTWRPPIQNPHLVKGYKVFYKVTSDTHYKSVSTLKQHSILYTGKYLPLFYFCLFCPHRHGQTLDFSLFLNKNISVSEQM